MNGSNVLLDARRRKGLWRRMWINRRLYLFVLPTIGLLVTFSYYPALSALVHAFFKWSPFGGEEYIGLGNFRQLYNDLFKPLAVLTPRVWALVQGVAWGVPALLGGFFFCTEWAGRRRGWRQIPPGALMLAGVGLAVVALVVGVGRIRSDMSAMSAEQLARAASVLRHFVAGHIALIVLAGLQWLGWRRHLATGQAWSWRLLAFSTVATVIFGVGMLLRLSQGGDLRTSCWNLFRVMTFSLTMGLFMPLLIALILYRLRSDRWKYLYRVLFVIPMVVPGIVGVLIWKFIYDYRGVLNNVVRVFRQPVAQMCLIGLIGFLAAYITVIGILTAVSRGTRPWRPILVLLVLVLLPAGILVAYPLSDASGSMGVAEFFMHYGPGQVLNNAWIHLGVLAALFAWLTVKAIKSIRFNRRVGGNWVLPACGGALLAVILGAALWGGAARGGGAAGLADYVSRASGWGLLGSVRLTEQDWLGNTRLALYSVMFMGFPWVGTISMLIFYAGLQSIPTAVLDSAKLDGATGLKQFRHIEFPLILGQFKLLLILGVIGGIQGFQTVLILTWGGPGKSTEMPGLLMYKEAFNYSHLGYGTTIGVAMFLVILLLTYINMKYIRPAREEPSQ